MNRRNLLKSALILPVAPAIVRAEWIMPVRPYLLRGETVWVNGVPYAWFGMLPTKGYETLRTAERLLNIELIRMSENYPNHIVKDGILLKPSAIIYEP